jgi:hypothetical protein
MLIDEIEPELMERLSDPALLSEPTGLSKPERERWKMWRNTDKDWFTPSPAQIDAGA